MRCDIFYFLFEVHFHCSILTQLHNVGLFPKNVIWCHRKKEVDYFSHHYTTPAATIEARVAFNATRQIVLVRLDRLSNVTPRLVQHF